MFLDHIKNQISRDLSLFIGEDTAFRSAVIIPFVRVGEEWHILFEVRSFTMRKQPGDISFPGGGIDATDHSPLHAALRETGEELGVDPSTIKVIGELRPYVASPSFVVYPFVAEVDLNEVNPNKDEVEEVFTVPLNWLLHHEPSCHHVSIEAKPSPDFPFHKIYNGDKYQWKMRQVEEWFYDYNNYTIWGLTARILKHFIELLK